MYIFEDMLNQALEVMPEKTYLDTIYDWTLKAIA